MDENTKKQRAAYALNLCTVSVSQILDYDDLNVMEQEYDAILNNLNLENMPHDEALLVILKQLLDTITFFRIQEGDKQLIDKRYRQKMKDAIWSAAPNLGLIVAGGSPLTMAISLASQIGIGYMNYRKTKSSAEMELEEEKWRLQRTAIEQINALQRELFDTAWRLADTYEFEDEWRLSEKQIKHYDNILMDSNALRRYERLESIKDNFMAYPPFWYNLGNTANEIARDEELRISSDSRKLFREKASEYFAQYWKSNDFPLLREDLLASSCALEYADMLIEDGADNSLIIELIDKAAKYSGNALDVLQLCSVAYLRVNALDKAIPVLKILVNEDYNVSLNSQVLSGIYISEYKHSGNTALRAGYELLLGRINNPAYLIPWPEDGKDSEEEFVANQRRMAIDRYTYTINAFNKQYTVKLNQLIPSPNSNIEYNESWYSEANKDDRISDMQAVLDFPEKRKDYIYCNDISNLNFEKEYTRLLNQFCVEIESLRAVSDIEKVVKVLTDAIVERADLLNNTQEHILDGIFTIDDYKTIQECCSEVLRASTIEELISQVTDYCNSINDMGEFSVVNGEVADFCTKHELAIPDSQQSRINDAIEALSVTRKYINVDILGDQAGYNSERQDKRLIMSKIINNRLGECVKKTPNLLIKLRGEDSFDKYFDARKRTYLKKYKPEILAIIDDTSLFTDVDLLLTTTGVLCVSRDILVAVLMYDAIDFNEATSEIRIGSTSYSNKTDGVAETIYATMKELGNITKEDN